MKRKDEAQQRIALLERRVESAYNSSGVIYIMTTPAEAKRKRFKSGRCKDVKGRLSTYRTGAPDAVIDFTIPCLNHAITEKLVHYILREHREGATEWFTVDRQKLEATMKAAASCVNNLIRHVDVLADQQVDIQIDELFAGFKQSYTVKDQVIGEGNVAAEGFDELPVLSENFCPINSWLGSHLTPTSKGRVHLHRLLKAFGEFMTRSGHANFPIPSSKDIERKLTALGYTLTKSTERQRDNKCNCNCKDRYVQYATLKDDTHN